MEFVQDKTFYHIHKFQMGALIKNVGNSRFVGEQKNYFFSYYDSFLPKSIADFASCEERLNNLKTILNDYLLYVREIIFEEIRIKYFPQLPSRQTGMWLIPHNEESLQYWKKKLCASNDRYQILEIKCSGKLFKANEVFLHTHIGAFDIFRKNAFKYWSGLDTEIFPNAIEYLFQGFVEVSKIIFSYTSEQ